ncbi:MAG: hypothetical protein MK081_15630, partial [Flavobacteriales bacterium]|nr:hypothetical protein [Flavobacteriales bacterium]
ERLPFQSNCQLNSRLNDYYPFGMLMPGRTFAQEDYRYGFNGMESDDEFKGNGNSYTTLYRQYDSRVGIWLSKDPLYYKYPFYSPYSAFNNNPVVFTDRLGLEGDPVTGAQKREKKRADRYAMKHDGQVLTYIDDKGRTRYEVFLKTDDVVYFEVATSFNNGHWQYKMAKQEGGVYFTSKRFSRFWTPIANFLAFWGGDLSGNSNDRLDIPKGDGRARIGMTMTTKEGDVTGIDQMRIRKDPWYYSEQDYDWIGGINFNGSKLHTAKYGRHGRKKNGKPINHKYYSHAPTRPIGFTEAAKSKIGDGGKIKSKGKPAPETPILSAPNELILRNSAEYTIVATHVYVDGAGNNYFRYTYADGSTKIRFASMYGQRDKWIDNSEYYEDFDWEPAD